MIRYSTKAPAADAFSTLFETTGWNLEYRLSTEELAAAINNSWLCICAYQDNRLVGFGRVVTDQVMHAMIYDLIVAPEYQTQGIGGAILERLVESCLRENIRDIQLFSAKGKAEFYIKRGFKSRPDDAPGMQYRQAD